MRRHKILGPDDDNVRVLSSEHGPFEIFRSLNLMRVLSIGNSYSNLKVATSSLATGERAK